MGKSLTEIVNSALGNAESNLKLASARDAVAPDPGDFLADELGFKTAEDDNNESEPKREKKDEKAKLKEKGEEEKTSSILDNAAYATKLAAALDTAAAVVEKLTTTSFRNAPGPVVLEAGHQVPSKHPIPVTTSVPGPQKSHGGGGDEDRNDGNWTGIETNRADYRDPDWTKNKEAALKLAQAKMASAALLQQNGQLDAAERMLKEAQKLQQKVAADPSSPQASLPVHNESFRLDTSPGPSSYIPDNSGLISMTRAQGKDKTTWEATRYFSEKPKKDNAVAAHVGRTDGQKVSSLNTEAVRAYLKKIASKHRDPDATPEERARAASLIKAVRRRTEFDPEELLN